MKVISLAQPWASLIAYGRKRVETRSWKTDYRGPLAIHASAGLTMVGGMKGLYELVGTEPFLSSFVGTPHVIRIDGEWMAACATMPRGRIVAVCDLVDVVTTRQALATRMIEGKPEESFGDYSDGRYAWLLRNIRRIGRPIVYRGGLGLRDLDPPGLLELADYREPAHVYEVGDRVLLADYGAGTVVDLVPDAGRMGRSDLLLVKADIGQVWLRDQEQVQPLAQPGAEASGEPKKGSVS